METAESSVIDDVDLESAGPHNIWSQFPEITGSKLFHEYLTRLAIGRDMHVIVTAASETGVGKTTLAVALALLWDQHGWTADKAAVASAPEYSHKYDEVPPGSVLILDEAEKAVDNRRGTSKGNVELSQAFAAKRYRQVFGIMTAPAKGWVDDRLGSDAADYWVQALETDEGRAKGEARVYRLRNHEHYETDYTTKTEEITWPVLDGFDAFRELDERKRERLEGKGKNPYVHRDTVDQIKQDTWDEAERQTENRLMKRMAELENGLTQEDIADVFEVHQTTVSRRLDEVGADA